jgi:KDEL-tailed cysteine endopeptidase
MERRKMMVTGGRGNSSFGIVLLLLWTVIVNPNFITATEEVIGGVDGSDNAFATYFAQLNPEHFTVSLPLFTLNPKDYFHFPGVVSYDDMDINAAAIRKQIKSLSEDQAYQRLIKLKTYLITTKAVVNATTLQSLQEMVETKLLSNFLTNVTQMDVFAQDVALQASHRSYRAILLGLHALVVIRHNQLNPHGKLGVNHLAILDPSDLKNFKGLIFDTKRLNATSTTTTSLLSKAIKSKIHSQQNTLPDFLDWAQEGAVGPVLNQGSCGCCWAFASVAVMEGHLVVSKKGNLTNLSEQQIASCSSENGCAGNTIEAGFQYAQVSGIVANLQYPYVNGDSSSTPACQVPDTKDTILTATVFPTNEQPIFNTEQDLQHALASVGPIALAIAASSSCFSQYSSGVLMADSCACYTGPTSIDHAVTLVGYGTTTDGVDYWIVKNSWGVSWGSAGYILLQRNVDTTIYPYAMCGLLYGPSYPKSVSLTKACSGTDPASYCSSGMQEIMYSNINMTTGQPTDMCTPTYAGAYPDASCTFPTGLPVWAWVLIGIGAAIGCVLLVLLLAFCCDRYAPPGAKYNIFARKNKGDEGQRLLSKEDQEAGKGPLPNADPKSFPNGRDSTETDATADPKIQ